jgi:cyanophycinase
MFRGNEFRHRRLTGWLLLLAIAGLFSAFGSGKFPLQAVVEESAEKSVEEPAVLQPAAIDARVTGGSLMIVGGGAVTPDIRRRFVELAGGPQARIVLIPGSDPTPEGEQRLLSPWKSSGVSSIILVNAKNHEQADDPDFCTPLKEATGVWFGGGDQALLADRYVDSLAQQCLHELLQRNGVVGGCSAGAALLSRVMIRAGDPTPVEAKGLDLLSNVIIDQHFLARNRLWRLEQMLEVHPNLIGLGIDEATALVIQLRSWKLSVVGESYSVVCFPPAKAQFPRIEILKPGDEVSLSQLRQEHFAFHPAPSGSMLAGH